MDATGLPLLIAVFFATSLVSVVTGGTSLVTVPAMIALGVEPRGAVATNMLALAFLSLGGTLPFLGGPALSGRRLPWLVALTLVSSLMGAGLLAALPSGAVPAAVASAMLAVAAFAATGRLAAPGEAAAPPARASVALGYLATFLLGVYGGFFSGGYVMLLTAALGASFRMRFLEAVATTKVLNLVSSVAATALFARQGLVDWRLGSILGVVACAGALVGGTLARRMSERRLRRLFLVAVVALAAKTLLWGGARRSP